METKGVVIRFSTRIIVLALLVALTCSSCLPTRVISVRTSGSRVPSGGMLYALPKTEICVDVTLLHRDTSQAPYAVFAEEMLAGVKPVPPYRIADVTASTRLVADENHYYYVLPRRTSLQVDRRHLLRAVGMDDLVYDNSESVPQETDRDTTPSLQPLYNLYDRVDTFYRRGDTPGHPSLTLSKKDARSLRRQAQDVAEQIGSLQEQRRQLVEGDRDDSRSPDVLRYQLQLLDEQIEALTALFMGRETSATIRFLVTPTVSRGSDADSVQTLFHFSPERGIVEQPGDEAVTVYYTLQRQNSLRSATRFVRFHTGNAARMERRNSIKYREAEQVEFRLESPLFQMRRTLPVVQYGPILELPRGRVKARFDAETGELIYLSR